MSTYVLGISAFYHDSAAALVRDGDIVAAAQEERFTRRKFDDRFPTNAIAYCLSEGKIGAKDLDYVVFYESPWLKFDRLLESYVSYAPRGFESFRRGLPLWVRHKLRLPWRIKESLGGDFNGAVHFVSHHESHAASAFFPSPFEEAAILTIDAVGEWCTSSVGVGRGNRIRLTHEIRYPHSLGMLYSAFTYYTGFKVNSGEYKLMGLAPYGVPRYVDTILENLIQLGDDGSFALDMSYFNYAHGLTMTSEKFARLFGSPPRKPERPLTQRDMDLAASIQRVCEEVVLRMARHAQSQCGLDNAVLAGGVALNCVANGRLLREKVFDRLWIQPAAGDAGGALGAALWIWHQMLENPRQPRERDTQSGSLLGPAFTNDTIRIFLDSVGAKYDWLPSEDALLARVSDLLAQENVIGWFHGRMEYGPRALGSRSIIADARSTRMQQTLNLKIKFRESFRPFAPCVLAELAQDVFDLDDTVESPYMLLVAPVLEKWRTSLSEADRAQMRDSDLRVRVAVPRSAYPAITHVDYSARVQTCDEERHGRFYRLLRTFHEVTGSPVLVNTSFNIRGEPIVCNPEDAYRCFLATDMDCLVLENCVLHNASQDPGLFPHVDNYRKRYADLLD